MTRPADLARGLIVEAIDGLDTARDILIKQCHGSDRAADAAPQLRAAMAAATTALSTLGETP